jgi:hypothetical protein
MKHRFHTAFLAGLLYAATAQAAPITYSLNGTIELASPVTGIPVGTPFSGTLVYDPDAWLAASGSDWVRFQAMAAHAAIDIGGVVYEAGGGQSYRVLDAASVSGKLFPPGTYERLVMDLYLLPPYGPFLSSNAYMQFTFADADFALFNGPSTTLPASLFGLFEHIQLDVMGMDEAYGNRRSVSGLATLAEPSAVLEPASLLLFGTGLVGLRAWRKRRA